MDTGFAHTLAIKNDGTLWAWGLNDKSQLGLGDSLLGINQSSPQQVGVGTNWKAVATGWYHTLAIKNDGTLWAWGLNDKGQLGLGNSLLGMNQSSPQQVGVDEDWKFVIAGEKHTLAIKNDGSLYAWGENDLGQLGLGDDTDRAFPFQVGVDKDWKSVSTNWDHTLAIKDGSLYAWGANFYGQLGNGEAGSTATKYQPVPIGTAQDWKSVATGGNHTLAIKNDGSLHAWGLGGQGQLGFEPDDTFYHRQTTPKRVGFDNDWEYVAAGCYHTIAQKKNSTIYAWGLNVNGQLGLGAQNITIQETPQRLGSAADLVAVSARETHSVALRRSGILWAWGSNGNGQLGDGTNNNRFLPGAVKWE